MLQDVGRDDDRVTARRQGGRLDVARINGAVVWAGVRSPERMGLNRVDDYPIRLQQLPQEPLRRSHIQHWRTADAAHEPSDLLMATL